jgi:hypothetical protein
MVAGLLTLVLVLADARQRSFDPVHHSNLPYLFSSRSSCSLARRRSLAPPTSPSLLLLVWGGALREAQCTSLNTLRTNHHL